MVVRLMLLASRVGDVVMLVLLLVLALLGNRAVGIGGEPGVDVD
jgi:hypothetical protein